MPEASFPVSGFPFEFKTPTFQVSGLGCRYGRRFRFGSQARDQYQYLYLNTRTRYLMAETRDLRMHSPANPPVSL